MSPRDPDILRLASYNIRKALGTDRRRSPDRVLEVIAALEADIAVLQEADMRLGRRPAALSPDDILARTGLRPVEVDPTGISLGWHGIALLLRPPIAATAMRLLDLPALEPRGTVIADLETRAGPLRLVGVHLGLLRTNRRRQLTAVLEHLRELPALPTAIAGDFNEWSRSVGLGRLHAGFTIHAPGLSFHAQKPVAALDRIATGPGLAVAAMAVHQSRVAERASDHLPIWADLRLPS